MTGVQQGFHLPRVGVGSHRPLLAGQVHGDEVGSPGAPVLQDLGPCLGGADRRIVEADRDHRPRRTGGRLAARAQLGHPPPQLALQRTIGAGVVHQIARAVTATR